MQSVALMSARDRGVASHRGTPLDPQRGAAWARRLGPLVALVVVGAAVYVLSRELTHLQLQEIAATVRSIPRLDLLSAIALTIVSYWLLSYYDWLGLRYVARRVPYSRVLLTSFVANSLGHNLSLPAFTAAAVRLRLYAPAGLNTAEIVAVTAFCSVTTGLGLAVLAAVALLGTPARTDAALGIGPVAGLVVAVACVTAVTAYAAWSAIWRRPLAIRGWLLRPPGKVLTLAQLSLAALDLSISAAVLWLLLPKGVSVDFLTLLGAYAAAVTAGLLSHIPGGLGVFEAVMIFALPGVPTNALLGSLLAYRGIYYLGPFFLGAALFIGKQLAMAQRGLARVRSFTAAAVVPVVPHAIAALSFVGGAILLVSGATPAIDARIAALRDLLPLPVLELSHLVASVIGLGLLILARALLRRVQAAYYIACWLLLAGIAATLLKGFDFEEALLLTIALVLLVLGRTAFYRPTSILAERFTPAWTVSIIGVVGAAVWIGFLAYRHVEYSNDLWWTFAADAQAPRMLRASLLVIVLTTGYLALNLLRPARPASVATASAGLERAGAIIERSPESLANAALAGDKRLLFSDTGDAFLMYQIAGRSWVALGDPVGPRERAEELAWRFRELCDLHGGRIVFYQVGADYLPLYADLGLAALKIGEEAHVPLTGFSLEGSARAPLRQAHARAAREGARFEYLRAEHVPELLPELRRISDAWLATKSTSEKRFSVGSFSEDYLRHFDIALVRVGSTPVAFANLWRGAKQELSVDLMRFDAQAPRGTMDFLFAELMQWGRREGAARFNLGMAPLAGLGRHPLAPVWHKVGDFIFRRGEHFYHFEGLRQYKAKFHPEWVPKYLATQSGTALPGALIDVAVLIGGGVRGLVSK